MTRARRLLVSTVTFALAALTSGGARADELMLSNDGVTWHTDLVGGMFGGSRAWVPGESRTGQLSVRNATEAAGELSLQLTGPATSPLTHHLLVRARVGSAPWSAQRRLPYDRPLAIGTVAGSAEELVTVRITLDPGAKAVTESRTAPLGVTFRLAQIPEAAAVIPPAGAPVLWPWALLGGLATGVGAYLLAARRRGSRTEGRT